MEREKRNAEDETEKEQLSPSFNLGLSQWRNKHLPASPLIGSVLTLEFYEIFIKLHIVLNIHIYIFPMTQMKESKAFQEVRDGGILIDR